MIENPSYRLSSGRTTPDTRDAAQNPPRTNPGEAVANSTGVEVATEVRPALVTVEDAAAYLAIGRSRMFQLLAGPDPAIPSLIVSGRQRRVRVSDLDSFIAQRLTAGDVQ